MGWPHRTSDYPSVTGPQIHDELLQHYIVLGTVMDVSTLRMPITVASRRGVSSVVGAAGDQRVALTSHGRVVAVVDSAERIDDSLRGVREAALAILDAAADVVSGRSAKLDLDEVCARVGVDVETVRRRVAETMPRA